MKTQILPHSWPTPSREAQSEVTPLVTKESCALRGTGQLRDEPNAARTLEAQDAESFEQRAARLQKELEEAQAKIQQLSDENERLSGVGDEIERLKIQKKALRQRNKKITKENETLKKSNKKLLAKNHRLTNRAERAESKLREAEQKIKSLTENMQKLREAFDAADSKLNENSQNSNRPPSTDTIYNRRKSSEKKPEEGDNDAEPPSSENAESAAQDAESTATAEQSADEDACEDSPSSEEESSVDEPDETPIEKSESEKPKRKARHPGVTQSLHEHPTHTEDCKPSVCPHCGCTEFEDIRLKYVHQYVELLQNLLEIIHFMVYEGTCSCCGKKVVGKVPDEYRHEKFGPRIHALVAWLNMAGGVTRRPLQKFFEDVLGCHISQGGIQKIVARVSEAVKPYYDRIGHELRRHWFNNFDETSWRTIGQMGKHLHWLWTGCNQYYAYFKVLKGRRKQSFLIMVDKWTGILISDDWCTYIDWPHGRQTCIAHLIRAARKISQSKYKEHAAAGKWLLTGLKNLCTRDRTGWNDKRVRNLHLSFLKGAQQFKNLGGDTRNLINRIDAEFLALTYFLTHPGIEPTNNHAERTIRAGVVLRKMMFGSASLGGEVYTGRLLSLRQTCAFQKVSFFGALEAAMGYYRKGVKPDLRWLGKYHWYTIHNFGKPPYAFPKLCVE